MKRHHTDGVSLTFALIFLGIAAWWLVARYVDLPLPRIGWFVAAGLILLGGLGLIGALRSGRSTGSSTAEPVVETAGPGGDPVPAAEGVPGRGAAGPPDGPLVDPVDGLLDGPDEEPGGDVPGRRHDQRPG